MILQYRRILHISHGIVEFCLIGLLAHIEVDKAGLRRLGSLGRRLTSRCAMASPPNGLLDV